MTRKLTIDYVRDYVLEETDEILISKKYKNAHAKLEFECVQGHRYKMRWGDFQQGIRCAVCYGNAKLTIEYVKEETERDGTILISKRYKNNKTKLEFQCQEGHHYELMWADFQGGIRCVECAWNKRRLTIEYVRSRVSETDETLISKRYKNSYSKLEFECSEGHRYRMVWYSFQRGDRCAKCRKIPIERIRAEAKKDGTILVGKKYKNNHKKLEFECPQGHRYRMTWINFKSGHRCPSCAKYGFDKNKPATLYYLEILHRGRFYYKIGITNHSVKKRYRRKSDQKKITILAEWGYERGEDCRNEEQRILDDFADWRYKGKAKILEGVGNTEIFTENVLQI